MILELRLEKERLDEAIQALERLGAGKKGRRARTAQWLAGELEAEVTSRPVQSAVQTIDQPGAQAAGDS